jgi:hypothetical protein
MRYLDGVDLALAAILAVAALASIDRVVGNAPLAFKAIVRKGLALHLIGGVARYLVNALVYGTGDSFRYFRAGNAISDAVRQGDFEGLPSSGEVWGTAFVDGVSGLVQIILGQHFVVESLVFTLLGFWGLVMMATALARSFPRGANWHRSVALILYWPSLCFWPSTIGKEPLILLALGLVVVGWTGNGSTLRLNALLPGMALAVLIRPHIAMMLAVAIAAAEWLAPARQWSAQRILRALVLAVLSVFAVSSSLQRLGVESDIDAMAEFAEDRAGRTQTGGSRIEMVSGPAAVPMAFVNVLMRPFLWEVRNPVMLLSAVEMLALWWMLWQRRGAGVSLFTQWRRSRLLLFAVPAAAMLTVFYGSFVSNLGILARQRVVILPLLFMLIEFTPLIAGGELRRRQRAGA